MSRRFNYFTELTKKMELSGNLPPHSGSPASPSQSTGDSGSMSIPSLDLPTVQQHYPNQAVNGDSTDVHANDNTFSSSPTLPTIGVKKSTSSPRSCIASQALPSTFAVEPNLTSTPSLHLATIKQHHTSDPPNVQPEKAVYSTDAHANNDTLSSSLSLPATEVNKHTLSGNSIDGDRREGPRPPTRPPSVATIEPHNSGTIGPKISATPSHSFHQSSSATTRASGPGLLAPSKPARSSKTTPSAEGPNFTDGCDSRTPPPRTLQIQRRLNVRPRSNYGIDDGIQPGDDQEEPAPKRIKGEPILHSSPSTHHLHSHNPTHQPLKEPRQADSAASEMQIIDEGNLSLIESINDDFEKYLKQRHRKAEMLRDKWRTCSIEEWAQGGSEIAAKFDALVKQVQTQIKSKIEVFAGLNARMADYTQVLGEREKALKRKKELAAKETGRVVEAMGR